MKTKFYRVARSGKTIDGREITPQQIDQMAANYDPSKYGARIWCEHLRSLLPSDTPFKAYGDVLALKAETDADGARVLLAQVDATDDLVKLSQERQKVYWSIEMHPNFAGTGQAYMMGLAVTDTPASLGTEMLKFSIQNRSSLPGADKLPDHLYSEAVEAAFEEDAPEDKGPSLFSRVKAMLKGQPASDDARFRQLEDSSLAIAETVSELRQDFAKLPDATAMQQDLAKLRQDLDALTTKLSVTPGTPARPQHPGTPQGAADVTDC
ncbi:GPO family capsid scaffolding protein [Telmatospirillum sp. J64-1]|uniref:GPO family capsid scaffolding protein n=1 Tax=Telmatospirillum sp. J64-1 TaxID=2502183 RepID=UPI00163D8253|nr:GPO family capsid scaffolding protein [Telmatospirillum sp. J64-1]